jgi:hypothetical protein
MGPVKGNLGDFPVKQQLKVSLDPDLRNQLEEASAKAGHSLGQEIRSRLARSFIADAAFDPITRELTEGIANLAAAVHTDLGAQWHSFPAIHEIFAAVVRQRIAAYKPQPNPGAEAAVLALLGKTGAAQLAQAPDVLGSAIERADQRIHLYEELQSVQRRKSPLRTKYLQKKEDKP